MHIRLTNFLRKNKILFSCQFGFRSNYSTNHALVSLTEMTRNAFDNDNFACGVFIDLQKAFDTVNHDILLSKLNHYGIRGVAFDWFKSYLDRTQYVTINNERSKIQAIKYGVPQGSILGPLLFLKYINDLSRSIKTSKIHHFADDTNLLYANSSLKDINKKINFDLSNLVQWFRANKIALNVNKTDIVILRSPRKQITKKMNFCLSGQKIRQKTCTRYLGVLIDEHLLYKDHINFLKQKVNRANGTLAKLRHHLPSDILKTVYYCLWNTHLRYACQVWGQSNIDKLVMVQRAQSKALRIINFKEERHPSAPLYTETKILNLTNIITLNNCMLVFDHLNSVFQLCSMIRLNLLKNNIVTIPGEQGDMF